MPPLVGVVALAVGGAALLAWLSDQLSVAPAVLFSLGLAGALGYALTALAAGPIVAWAFQRTLGSLRLLLPMASRALPLLLVFVTFLFINAEVWQLTASLSPGVLWLTVLLLTGLAVVFLLVRLPEEVDRVDDGVDADSLRRTTAGTPAEGPCARLLEDGRDPASNAQVTSYSRANLVLVLLVVQIMQVLLLVVAVFAFFLLFGSLVMTRDVQVAWTGMDAVRSLPGLANVSVELMKVSMFLAAFSGLYFTVSAVTDDTYRGQFFASVTDELERAVGVRAVYLAVLDTTRD